MEKESAKALLEKIRELEYKLEESNDTIDAIRNGQVDALVLNRETGLSLYTLKSADHAYRIFIEKMAEGAVTLNLSGLIIYSNSKFATVVNHPLNRVIGSFFHEFVSEDYKKNFLDLFTRSLEHRVETETFLRSGDRQVPVKLSMTVLQMDGETSLNIIVTDLTTQKKSQLELKEKNELLQKLNEALSSSNHDLQQFASIASHDLQEPLRKIQVYSKFLKDIIYDQIPEASKVHLEKIIASSNRMKTLIVDILTYSKLSADDAQFETVDLNSLFDEIIEDFDLRISERNAVIEIGELPTVEVNKGQMRQVFTNLISNALKFTRPGVDPHISVQIKKVNAKEIGVSLMNEDAYCRLVIKDNGIGFNEKFASSILSLFEKLNPKSAFEGSGIGLAIAKKVIDKHHGIIIARSQEGVGSEFNIILPLRHTESHGN